MSHRRGFALIAVLWLLVAIAAGSLAFSLRARDRRRVAANGSELVRARAAAEAGLERVRMGLEQRARGEERILTRGGPTTDVDPWWYLDGVAPDSGALRTERYSATLRDANSALNLNRASEDQLRRLMIALRVDAGVADRLAQCIMDWKDPDDLHRGRGAERAEYIRLDSPVLPANAPFLELRELLYVKGMTRAVYDRILPHLTLLGTGQVNLNTAPEPVLLALPGITPEAAEVILRDRRGGRRVGSVTDLQKELSSTGRDALQENLSILLAATTTETREVEVHARGWTSGGVVRSGIEALFVRAGSTTYQVWRRAE
ncbi:MAG TPA: type II secretion system protein GspK [Longimicrobiaceae bacterium]|nr:type II secretion system protein GspK [Longimicrobiaceae bacterium]